LLCESPARLVLRRFFEKRVNSLLRIAFNYQALFSGSWFTLSTFGFLFFWHLVLSYLFRQRGPEMVPQPGLEPGRLNWARGCKPRLSANFSTGGRKLDVGMEGPSNRAIPTCFGPSSAASSHDFPAFPPRFFAYTRRTPITCSNRSQSLSVILDGY
jgi:hypothetical protein